jgi:drug/metabolite transporter (DMT)-like permease
MFTDVGVLSALGAAVVAATCWMLAIARLDVGYAYPFITLSFLLVPVGSTLLFGGRPAKNSNACFGAHCRRVTLSALAR